MTDAVVAAGAEGVGVEDMTVAVTEWAIPLSSLLMRSVRPTRVYGGIVDTVNVGSRAPGMPSPYLYCAAREGHTATKSTGAPDQGAWGDLFHNGVKISWFVGDHFSNILLLDLHILILTRQSTHSQISA
jgi:hypothetical protein